jgi:hypothetical protein
MNPNPLPADGVSRANHFAWRAAWSWFGHLHWQSRWPRSSPAPPDRRWRSLHQGGRRRQLRRRPPRGVFGRCHHLDRRLALQPDVAASERDRRQQIVGQGVFVGQGKGVVPMENPSDPRRARCPALEGVAYCY